MKAKTLNRVSQLARYTLLAGATLFIIVYLVLVFFRIRYPFELEWMEGGSLDHVIRILSGQKLYIRPSLEFVPFIYTPLYFYLAAAISKIIGPGFMALRLISFISSLGCFFIVFLFVKRETKNTFYGIIASCSFAATFRISGAWFDIARADSLFLLFLLAALYLVKFHASVRGYIVAGILISLSFLTKQTALVISLPVMLYCAFSNRRLFMFLTGTIVVIIGASTLLLNHLHNGWYIYYIFDLLRGHPVVKKAFLAFWPCDIAPVSIAFTISISYLFIQLLNKNRDNYLYYLSITVGMLGGAFFSRLHSGGYNNVLFPAYAVISILFGLGVNTLFKFVRGAPYNRRKLTEIYLYLACLIQFACLIYNPFDFIPAQKDLDAGRKLINTITQMKGDIFIPYHPYLATLAGKGGSAQAMAMSDVLRGDAGHAKENLITEIRQAIRDEKFSTIILDSSWIDDFSQYDWFRKDLEKYYTKRGEVFDNEGLFWPTTGMRTRPEFIYIPKANDK